MTNLSTVTNDDNMLACLVDVITKRSKKHFNNPYYKLYSSESNEGMIFFFFHSSSHSSHSDWKKRETTNHQFKYLKMLQNNYDMTYEDLNLKWSLPKAGHTLAFDQSRWLLQHVCFDCVVVVPPVTERRQRSWRYGRRFRKFQTQFRRVLSFFRHLLKCKCLFLIF